MDKEQLILESIEMRENGYTYEEIAKKFGYTKQYIYQIIGRKRKFNKSLENLKYKGLKKYFRNNDLSFSKFEKICKLTRGKFLDLCNCGDCSLKISQIKKMQKITGMTFEELFEDE